MWEDEDDYSEDDDRQWRSEGNVANVPSLAHAWEKHHVQSWLHSVGLGDLIANFRSAKVKGEDLLKITPKNAAANLKLRDETTVMRVVAAVMPLIKEWKAARRGR